jgi:murein DD-endopeptidase MepM/ murein hydrolase activator NlpD
MPRVPSQFVPQVGLQDGALPPVQPAEVVPMRSFAGEQQQQMGQSMERLGNVTWRIGQIIEDEMNEARIKEAEIQLGTAATNILRGQNGYFTTDGRLAEDAFMPAADALDSEATRIRDSLDNDMQRATFTQLAQRNLLQWKGSMADHRNRKVREYNIGTSVARADMYADAATAELATRGRTNAFDVDAAVAIKSIQEAMMLQGVPLGSPQMIEAEQKVWGKIATNGVKQMADARMYQSALEYLDEERDAGHISESVYTGLRAPLLDRRRQQVGEDYAYSIKNSGTLESSAGTGNFINPVLSGDVEVTTSPEKRIRYSVLPNTPIHAPSNATVVAVDGDTLTLRASDGTRMHFYGVGTVNVEKGQKVRQNMIIGTPKRSEDGRAAFEYAMTRNDISIMPSNPNRIPIVGADGKEVEFRPPTDLAEALGIANMIPDREERRTAIAALNNLYAYDAAQFAARRMSGIADAKLWVADLMAKEAEKPTGEALVVTRKMVTDYAREKGHLPYMTLEDIQSIVEDTPTPDWIKARFESRDMTMQELERYADVIDPREFAEMRQKLNDPALQEYRIAQEELEEIFLEIGMDSYVNPAKDSKEEKAAITIRRNVNDLIRRAQSGAAKLDRESRERIIKEALAVHVWKPGPWYFPIWEGTRAMELQMSDASARPQMRDGESAAAYELRLDAWTRNAEARIRAEGDSREIPAWQVREAIFEIAAAGERIQYEGSVVPVARMLTFMSDANVPSDEMRRVMRVTAGRMTPAERTAAVESLVQRNEAVNADSVMEEHNLSVVARKMIMVGNPSRETQVSAEEIESMKEQVMPAAAELKKAGEKVTVEAVLERWRMKGGNK